MVVFAGVDYAAILEAAEAEAQRRNVAEDYVKIFGEAPDDPRAITISIDWNDTR